MKSNTNEQANTNDLTSQSQIVYLFLEENDQNKDVDIKAKILVLRSGKFCCIYLKNQSWANRHLQWHTRIMQKICSKLTIKAPELHQ